MPPARPFYLYGTWLSLSFLFKEKESEAIGWVLKEENHRDTGQNKYWNWRLLVMNDYHEVHILCGVHSLLTCFFPKFPHVSTTTTTTQHLSEILFYLNQRCRRRNDYSRTWTVIYSNSSSWIMPHVEANCFNRKKERACLDQPSEQLQNNNRFLMDVLFSVTQALTWHCCLFVHVCPKSLKHHKPYSKNISNKHFSITALSPSCYYIAI